MIKSIITKKRMISKAGVVLEQGEYPTEEGNRKRYMIYDKATGKHWFVYLHQYDKPLGGVEDVQEESFS